MKRLLLLTLVLVCFGLATFAQVPREHSRTGMRRGKREIERFQLGLGQHPSSFLIKAWSDDEDGIADYLVGTYKSLENAYLHIYFGVNDGDTALVMTGAKLVMDKSTGAPVLEHDKAKSGVWVTATHDPYTGVPYDLDFDFLDRCKGEPGDFSKCTDGVSTIGNARECIKNYQEHDGNGSACCKSVIFTTESFILSANDLREYLNQHHDVEYLQFYLGYKSLERMDNVTVLVVGVDKFGHHIWNCDEEGYIRMFNKATSCPTCNILNDKDLDHHRQGKPVSSCVAQK